MVEAYDNVRIIVFYGKFKEVFKELFDMSILPRFPLRTASLRINKNLNLNVFHHFLIAINYWTVMALLLF